MPLRREQYCEAVDVYGHYGLGENAQAVNRLQAHVKTLDKSNKGCAPGYHR